MKEFLIHHKKSAIIISSGVTITVIAVILMLTGVLQGSGDSDSAALPASNLYPTALATADSVLYTTVPASTDATSETSETTESETTEPPTTVVTHVTNPAATSPKSEEAVPFATAAPAAAPADYQAQWDAGYLVAIDNPDTSYDCSRIKLTDDDRDLLERLCYGEFGSGGFIGAAMIAQCVRDAMAFDGYDTVEDVIKYCRYDGSTTSGTSDDCVMAVRYIFDDGGSAVQHRMLYMYNPYMVQSAFHESQNFILSYDGVRFFDRFGY